MYISVNKIKYEYRNIKYLALFLISFLFMLAEIAFIEYKSHALYETLIVSHSKINKVDYIVNNKIDIDEDYVKIANAVDRLSQFSLFYDEDFSRLSTEYKLIRTFTYEVILLSQKKESEEYFFEHENNIDKKKKSILENLEITKNKFLSIYNEIYFYISVIKLVIFAIIVMLIFNMGRLISKRYIFVIDNVIRPLVRIQRNLDYGSTSLNSDVDNMKSKEVVDLINYIKKENLYKENLINEFATLNRENEDKRIKQKHLIEFATHEMRTPANSICGNVDLILKKNNDNIEYSDALSDIRTSANVLLSVINDFLDYSKLEASMYEPDLVEINVLKIMNDAKKISRTIALHGKVDIKFEFNSKELPLRIKSNEVYLRQILVNIISNSIAHTPVGGSVTINCLSDLNGNFRIEILDTGPGIPSEMINDIFEPFRQVDNNKKVGTGLGLTICKKFAELLNIKLFVESNREGSKFSLLFPNSCSKSISLTDLLVEKSIFKVAYSGDKSLQFQNNFECFTNATLINEDDFDLIVSTNDGDSRKGGNIINLQGTDILDFIFGLECHNSNNSNNSNNYIYTGKILVVEDNELNRKLMMRIFEQYSLVFQFAVNGKEAVDIALNQQFDLIFMDLEMPQMNGYDATLAIRRESQVPIVALSASFIANREEFCKEHGFNSYLSKPFTIDELFDVIQSLYKQ